MAVLFQVDPKGAKALGEQGSFSRLRRDVYPEGISPPRPDGALGQPESDRSPSSPFDSSLQSHTGFPTELKFLRPAAPNRAEKEIVSAFFVSPGTKMGRRPKWPDRWLSQGSP